MEIEEAIDGLNAAIEFRNDTIDRKQNIISQSISLDQVHITYMSFICPSYYIYYVIY